MLPQLLERVSAGEEVVLTRFGAEVAVLVRPDALRVRRADRVLSAAADVRDLLDLSRRRPLPTQPTLSEERAEELLADVQAARSRE